MARLGLSGSSVLCDDGAMSKEETRPGDANIGNATVGMVGLGETFVHLCFDDEKSDLSARRANLRTDLGRSAVDSRAFRALFFSRHGDGKAHKRWQHDRGDIRSQGVNVPFAEAQPTFAMMEEEDCWCEAYFSSQRFWRQAAHQEKRCLQAKHARQFPSKACEFFSGEGLSPSML